VLVAHSLGCIAVAHWARSSRRAVHGAFLVAPCDVEKSGVPPAIRGFAPIPAEPFAFPAAVVVSTDDPFLDLVRGQSLAFSWGARLHVVERCGHINVEAGFGPWPDGEALLWELLG
jgi:predicted alpha/beta hydrolase family esterase